MPGVLDGFCLTKPGSRRTFEPARQILKLLERQDAVQNAIRPKPNLDKSDARDMLMVKAWGGI